MPQEISPEALAWLRESTRHFRQMVRIIRNENSAESTAHVVLTMAIGFVVGILEIPNVSREEPREIACRIIDDLWKH